MNSAINVEENLQLMSYIPWFGTLSIKKSGLESVFCSSADERFATE